MQETLDLNQKKETRKFTWWGLLERLTKKGGANIWTIGCQKVFSTRRRSKRKEKKREPAVTQKRRWTLLREFFFLVASRGTVGGGGPSCCSGPKGRGDGGTVPRGNVSPKLG